MVLLALALAGCGATDQPTAPAQQPDFVKHANAVDVDRWDGQPSATSGINHLVPYGRCALGIGVYAGERGPVGTHWAGNADCTSFKLPAQGVAGLAAVSAVAMPDGSVIGANTVLQRLNADGTVTPLAALPPASADSQQGPAEARVIVRSGDRLVTGGGHLVGDNPAPLAWTSTDGGKTVKPVAVPPVDNYIGAMAASDNTVLAVEQTAESGRLAIWRSTDSGQSWQLTELDAKANPMVANLLRTPQGWLIVGTGEDEKDPAGQPFLASSSDGVSWKVIDTSAVATGRVVDATATTSGELVLVGEGGKSNCEVAWAGAVGSLRRVDLGCGEAAKATTTLADGRVIIVGTTSVWVRDVR
ncbi:hypothetical protein BCF44_104523 [Kutzneria buriramensis]|uniref:BNR repeat protein n=1 Tax=Kutzneria buriramensis TaxID=1045776 RepID=A0A3E0HUV9_9PSEU|nr:hypothetical protein BCF44_104523 [Kutzneria buriramensis]